MAFILVQCGPRIENLATQSAGGLTTIQRLRTKETIPTECLHKTLVGHPQQEPFTGLAVMAHNPHPLALV